MMLATIGLSAATASCISVCMLHSRATYVLQMSPFLDQLPPVYIPAPNIVLCRSLVVKNNSHVEDMSMHAYRRVTCTHCRIIWGYLNIWKCWVLSPLRIVMMLCVLCMCSYSPCRPAGAQCSVRTLRGGAGEICGR